MGLHDAALYCKGLNDNQYYGPVTLIWLQYHIPPHIPQRNLKMILVECWSLFRPIRFIRYVINPKLTLYHSLKPLAGTVNMILVIV